MLVVPVKVTVVAVALTPVIVKTGVVQVVFPVFGAPVVPV
jgi:hypothetical protein